MKVIFNFTLTVAAGLALGGCEEHPFDLDGGDLLTVGQAYVAQRGCPTCHQSANAADGTLSGQSTAVAGSGAYGSNLTPDVQTGLGGWADIAIVRATRYGLDNADQPLCPAMPRYDGSDPSQPAMTDLEASAILAYLRSLPKVAHAVPSSICPPVKPPPLPDLAMPPAPDLAMAPVDAAAGDAGADLAGPADGGAGG